MLVGVVREIGITFFPEIELAVLYLMAAVVLSALPVLAPLQSTFTWLVVTSSGAWPWAMDRSVCNRCPSTSRR